MWREREADGYKEPMDLKGGRVELGGEREEESEMTLKVLASAIWWMVPFRETRNVEGLESGQGMKSRILFWPS